jgi:hypothetical protein
MRIKRKANYFPKEVSPRNIHNGRMLWRPQLAFLGGERGAPPTADAQELAPIIEYHRGYPAFPKVAKIIADAFRTVN